MPAVAGLNPSIVKGLSIMQGKVFAVLLSFTHFSEFASQTGIVLYQLSL